MRASAFDVLLFAVYTLASTAALLLMRGWLGQARVEWMDSSALGWAAVLAGAGVGLYMASFSVWMILLMRQEVSVAYPVSIGLTLLFLSLGSTLILGERLSPARVGGMVLILTGVVLVIRS